MLNSLMVFLVGRSFGFMTTQWNTGSGTGRVLGSGYTGASTSSRTLLNNWFMLKCTGMQEMSFFSNVSSSIKASKDCCFFRSASSVSSGPFFLGSLALFSAASLLCSSKGLTAVTCFSLSKGSQSILPWKRLIKSLNKTSYISFDFSSSKSLGQNTSNSCFRAGGVVLAVGCATCSLLRFFSFLPLTPFFAFSSYGLTGWKVSRISFSQLSISIGLQTSSPSASFSPWKRINYKRYSFSTLMIILSPMSSD